MNIRVTIPVKPIEDAMNAPTHESTEYVPETTNDSVLQENIDKANQQLRIEHLRQLVSQTYSTEPPTCRNCDLEDSCKVWFAQPNTNPDTSCGLWTIKEEENNG